MSDWQGHLTDDASLRALYVDRDVSRWRDVISRVVRLVRRHP